MVIFERFGVVSQPLSQKIQKWEKTTSHLNTEEEPTSETSRVSNIPQTMDVKHSVPIKNQPLSQTFRDYSVKKLDSYKLFYLHRNYWDLSCKKLQPVLVLEPSSLLPNGYRPRRKSLKLTVTRRLLPKLRMYVELYLHTSIRLIAWRLVKTSRITWRAYLSGCLWHQSWSQNVVMCGRRE